MKNFWLEKLEEKENTKAIESIIEKLIGNYTFNVLSVDSMTTAFLTDIESNELCYVINCDMKKEGLQEEVKGWVLDL